MKSENRRKLTAFLLVVVIMGGVLVYAETMAPTLLDFPNALLNVGTIDTGQGAGELYGMDQDIQTSDAVTFASLNTGLGANELYDMDQNVLTTSAPTFATIDTGQGANELYDMDQNVLTTSAPTFATVDTGQGAKEIYAMDQDVTTGAAVVFGTVDTGQGANELYDMDQNVQTTDEPTFQGATVDWLQIGADNRTSWPSPGAGSGIDDYTFSYHVFTNATSTYGINGSTGSIDYSGAAVDVIQNCYDVASTSGGGDVVLSPGGYTINKQLNLTKKYVRIKGTGQVASSGSSNTVVFTISSDTSYVYINETDISIENVLFYGHWDTGIEEAIRIEDTGTNIDNVQIKYCRFRGFKKGIHLLNAFGSGAGNFIGWCTFDGPNSATSDGIYAEDMSHWTLQDNWFNIRDVANSSGIHIVSSETETYPHTERLVLINTGFNGFDSNNVSAIKVNITRPSDARGELDGFTMIGGYIENCWTGLWIISDGTRAMFNFEGTQFFSAYTWNIKIESGQDDTYIVADNCYQLDSILDEGGSHITVVGEWSLINDPLSEYMPVETFHACAPGGSTPSVDATRYFPVNGQIAQGYDENRVKTYVGKAGIIRNLRVHANPGTENAVLTIRIGGADTSITVTLTGGAGEGDFTDIANSATITAGGYITAKVVSGNTAPQIFSISIEYGNR